MSQTKHTCGPHRLRAADLRPLTRDPGGRSSGTGFQPPRGRTPRPRPTTSSLPSWLIVSRRGGSHSLLTGLPTSCKGGRRGLTLQVRRQGNSLPQPPRWGQTGIPLHHSLLPPSLWAGEKSPQSPTEPCRPRVFVHSVFRGSVGLAEGNQKGALSKHPGKSPGFTGEETEAEGRKGIAPRLTRLGAGPESSRQDQGTLLAGAPGPAGSTRPPLSGILLLLCLLPGTPFPSLAARGLAAFLSRPLWAIVSIRFHCHQHTNASPV